MRNAFSLVSCCQHHGHSTLSLFSLTALLTVSCASVLCAQTRPDPYNPEAIQRLRQMADAYAALQGLEQRSEFYSTLVPLKPPPTTSEKPDPAFQEKKLPIKMMLQYSRPNRFRIERNEPDPEKDQSVLSQWVSDGHTFWSYRQDKNWYTKEKAPGRLNSFFRLPNFSAGSLEAIMLAGINPFADIHKAADHISLDGTAAIRGTLTDIVLLTTEAATERTEARFYIGKTDSLLYRLIVETIPIIQPNVTPGMVGDPLDELVRTQHPAPPPNQPLPGDAAPTTTVGPTRSIIRYDNILSSSLQFTDKTFAFVIPAGALLSESFDPTGKRNASRLENQLDDILKQMNGGKKRKIHKVGF